MTPRMMLAWFGTAFFLSAALLFSVQPMVARMVLPQFGGAPAVWTTCMVFFQATLLAGYVYAHLLSKRFALKYQVIVHAVVVVSAIFLLPLHVPDSWFEQGFYPTLSLLLMLVVAAGAPLFVVTTTAPLLQHWFAESTHESAEDPYFLYAVSNTGSMVALLSYPFLIEPVLGISMQSRAWSMGYVLLAFLLMICGVMSLRSASSQPETDPELEMVRKKERKPQNQSKPSTATIEVNTRERLRWVLLAFVPSSWMLAVTNRITSDITPFPLLWIVPLALYLLTFILVFSQRQLIPRKWMTRTFPALVILLVAMQVVTGRWQLMAIQLAAFFIGAMCCHGVLADRRPVVAHLTEFYVWMSLGGILGGVFNALIAPVLFPVYLEFPITVLAACLIVAWDELEPNRLLDIAFLAGTSVGIALLLRNLEPNASVMLTTGVVVSIPVLLLLTYLDKMQLFAVIVFVILTWQQFDVRDQVRVLYRARSFFGVHQVVEDRPRIDAETNQPFIGFRRLVHGATEHGIQSLAPEYECIPLSYYHPSGPLGDIVESAPLGPGDKQSFGVIGLGTGAMACYSSDRRQLTFYEVDPVVKIIAESDRFFTYLHHCGADNYSIVMGDGRLEIAEANDHAFQLVVLDAFSSDAIPTHLLTREAIELYFEKLSEGGLLAFHISNKYLDLTRVLAANAEAAGLSVAVCRDSTRNEQDLNFGIYPSTYVVMAKNPRDIAALIKMRRWKPLAASSDQAPWTDDYSDVISALRWNPTDIAEGK